MATGQRDSGTDSTSESGNNGHESEIVKEFSKFSFFKLDRAWRHLPDETKRDHKAEFVAIVDEIAEATWLRSYSLVSSGRWVQLARYFCHRD